MFGPSYPRPAKFTSNLIENDWGYESLDEPATGKIEGILACYCVSFACHLCPQVASIRDRFGLGVFQWNPLRTCRVVFGYGSQDHFVSQKSSICKFSAFSPDGRGNPLLKETIAVTVFALGP